MTERAHDEADDRPGGFAGVTRRVLRRLPLDSRDLTVVEVTDPPGVEAPLHRHSVAGVIDTVEGIARSAYADDPSRRYRASKTLQHRADRPHILFRNCDAERRLRFLTTYALVSGRSYTMDP